MPNLQIVTLVVMMIVTYLLAPVQYALIVRSLHATAKKRPHAMMSARSTAWLTVSLSFNAVVGVAITPEPWRIAGAAFLLPILVAFVWHMNRTTHRFHTAAAAATPA